MIKRWEIKKYIRFWNLQQKYQFSESHSSTNPELYSASIILNYYI